ncbi:MAG: sodium transporter [Pyrinomonadaceae bacterium]|nr:MAG: sodium transporter [Pyrinomonadaceae bacterium]
MTLSKIFAVIKHEYKKIVLKWSFLIGTFLVPLLGLVFTFIPMLLFLIKGETLRLVIVDPTEKIKPRLEKALSEKSTNSKKKELEPKLNTLETQKELPEEASNTDVVFVDYSIAEKSAEQIRRELNAMITDGKIDAYLIVPEDPLDPSASYEFYSRKAEDFIVNSRLKGALERAIRAERLSKTKISEEELEFLNSEVKLSVKKLDKQGSEEESGQGFWIGFVIAILIYMILSVYGQTILSAVVEEKETRIAEILFSSAKPFELMIGKLIGVGLAGLTQLGIWLISASVILIFSLPYLALVGFKLISPSVLILFFVYFTLGFFTYASIFALIGSMVTSVQEGGQFSFLPVMIMLASFYLCFLVLRDPSSEISFWISIAPFSAPMAMPVVLALEKPPIWQITLSIFVNVLAVVGIVWLASRVYRVGMLMYGKRATIPEVWRWIKES